MCGVSASQIGDNAHFVDDLGLDSLSVIEAAVELDREFRIGGLSTDGEKLLVSVDQAVRHIQRCLQKAEGQFSGGTTNSTSVAPAAPGPSVSTA